MRVKKRIAAAIFGVLVCSAACDDDDDDPYPALRPAPNIDIEVCSSVAVSEHEANIECLQCCNVNSYDSASDYNGQCVCGQSLHYGDDDAICDAQHGTAELCANCCTDAGFNGNGWQGDPEGSCTCLGNGDADVCATVLPEHACHACCLNHGFLFTTTRHNGAPACICQ